MRSLSPARSLGALAASAVLLACLTGCGGDDADPSDDTSSPTASETTSQTVSETPSEDTDAADVLDEAALTDALITLENIPAEGFVESPPTEDEPAATGTCLDDISNFDLRQDFTAENKATIEFTSEGVQQQSQVSSTVESYSDEAAVGDALDAFLQLAQGCTTATGQDADGFTYDLTVQTTDEVSLDGADRQVGVTVTGTLSPSADQSFVARFGFVVASSGNNLAAVGASDLGEDLGDDDGVANLVEPIAQAQLDRLTGLR